MESEEFARLLEGRRFGDRIRRALELVRLGSSARAAARAVGLRWHQDVAAAARELGIGRRRTQAVEPDVAADDAA